jgi:hypothetical protein
MARHMHYTRRELRRRSYPHGNAALGVAGVIFFLGLLIALKTVLG